MTHKLLLADDSVTIQRVVELTFSGEDVQVVSVGDGEQAIARIPVELPDIVLADIAMPKRTGYDVAAFVKGRPDLSHIPVLLLAGAFEPVDETRAQQVHSDGVLVKPFEPRQVIACVRNLIESSQAMSAKRPAPFPFAVAEPRMSNSSETSATGAPAVTVSSASAATLDARARRGESKSDDYFERLDAAFAQLGTEITPTPAPPVARDDLDLCDVPTLENVLGGNRPGTTTAVVAPLVPAELIEYPCEVHPPPPEPSTAVEGPGPREGRNLVADMVAALFAVEQGEAATPSETPPATRAQAPVVTDGLVEEVTRRVIERLAPDVANELVAQIVSEVAERLIREEIARIKAAASARL